LQALLFCIFGVRLRGRARLPSQLGDGWRWVPKMWRRTGAQEPRFREIVLTLLEQPRSLWNKYPAVLNTFLIETTFISRDVAQLFGPGDGGIASRYLWQSKTVGIVLL
jgi:hypothetical protein